MTRSLVASDTVCENLKFGWIGGCAGVWAFLAVFGTVCAGAEEPTNAQQAALSPIEWHLESSHNGLSPPDRHFYLRIRVQAPESQEKGRGPLNLALVFDRSNSMDAENKIGFVRRAGHLVVDNLARSDHVALIAYNHEVQTLVPLHPVVNREYVHHRIEELHADGWTNISAGLLEGCAQLDKRLKEPGRHHVILLTDGRANQGVTDPDQLVKLVERCAQRGITVSTIGVGTDFDEDLLGRMVRAGRGRYTYVDEPEEIPTALKDELGAMLPIMAQNLKLEIKLPAGIEVDRLIGRDEAAKPDTLSLSMGDLTSTEERTLLLRLRANAGAAQPGQAISIGAVLSYDDPGEARRKTAERTVSLRWTAAADGDERTTPVLRYARLVEAVDKIAQAVNGMDRPLAAEVLEFRRSEYPELKQAARSSGDQDFVNKAFLFEHYGRELEDLIERGLLHEHSGERARLQKELHYRQYLMEHHRHGHH